MGVAQVMGQTRCSKHKDTVGGASCCLPAPLLCDLFWASGPCQPFSAARRAPDAITPQEHKGFNVTFGQDKSIIEMVREIQPHVFGMEQVLGFCSSWKTQEGSPKSDFMQKIMEIVRGNTGSLHFSSAAVFTLDSGAFIEGARPRLPVSKRRVASKLRFELSRRASLEYGSRFRGGALDWRVVMCVATSVAML